MRTWIYFNIFFLVLTLSYKGQTGQTEAALNGMVVSESDIASQIGVEIMQKGGNAIDAAVATGFALAVAYPSAGNIGGGGFIVISLSDGKSTSIDFREKAPAEASKNMFLNNRGEYVPDLSRKGMKSVGVPGSVAGLFYAWRQYGSLEWSELLQPAIELAENGFPLSYFLANYFNEYQKNFEKYPSSRKIFRDIKHPFAEGELFIQTDLANTLKEIRDKGAKGFYSGETAKKIVRAVRAMNGVITMADLLNYKPVERKPVIGEYKGYRIISMPPPSSGGIALVEILNVFENFDLSKEEWGSARYVHILSEIFKRVYADRSKHLGDADFYPVPADFLISKEYAREIASSVGNRAVPSNKISPAIIQNYESEETTHYSIVDSYGNSVSVTTTLNSSFGNKIIVEGAGFLLNNEMDDFSAKPGEPNQFGLLGSEANSIQPNKRMLSSRTPTIILKNGKPFLIVGSPGGSTIITTVAQVVLNVLEFNMDLFDAVNKPRIHHQWFPERIDYEEFGLSEEVKEKLIDMGHIIGKKRTLGRVNAILFEEEHIWGVSDKRSFGKAIGY